MALRGPYLGLSVNSSEGESVEEEQWGWVTLLRNAHRSAAAGLEDALLVAQDLAVQGKVLLASICIVLLTRDTQMLKVDNSGLSLRYQNQYGEQHAYIDSSEAQEMCGVTVDSGISRPLFIALAVLNQIIFATAIWLKHRRPFRRHATSIAYALTATNALLSVGKVCAVVYFAFLARIVFDCSSLREEGVAQPGPQLAKDWCYSYSVLYNIRDEYDPGCVVLSDDSDTCITSLDCENIFSLHSQTETIFLVFSFILSALYLSSLTFDYANPLQSAATASPAVDDAIQVFQDDEGANSDDEDRDDDTGESLGVAAEAREQEVSRVLRRWGTGPAAQLLRQFHSVEVRARRRKLHSQRLLYHTLRDSAALVKFVISLVALCLVMESSADMFECDAVPLAGQELLPGSVVAEQCNAVVILTNKTVASAMIGAAATALFVVFLVIEKGLYLCAFADTVVRLYYWTVGILFFGLLIVVTSISTSVPVLFRHTEWSLGGYEHQAGWLRDRTINITLDDTARSYRCEEQCHVTTSWVLWLLSTNMVLAAVYMLLLGHSYRAQAAVKATRLRLRELVGARPENSSRKGPFKPEFKEA